MSPMKLRRDLMMVRRGPHLYGRYVLAFMSRMKRQLPNDARNSLRWNLIEGAAIKVFNGDPTLQDFRDRNFSWIGQHMLAVGLTANRVSLIGLAFAILAAIFVNHPVAFALALVASMVCDGMDGVVARLSGSANDSGSLIDISCDTLSVLLVALSLSITGSISWVMLVAFALAMSTYTWRSMLKSKILNNIYRSVGSRIFTFCGLALVAFLGVLDVSVISTSQLIFSVLVLLSGAFFLDLFTTRLWN